MDRSGAGPLTNVTIAKDKEGNFKSFGFVCFKHAESVPYAISLLNGTRLYGRPIKLQYRFGSSHFDEPNKDFQGPDNGFVRNLAACGMPVMGEHYASPVPMSPMDSSYLSQAYLYFHGMMNQFITLQQPAYGWGTPEEQGGMPARLWNSEASFAPCSEPRENCDAGPSSTTWESHGCKVNQNKRISCKRSRVIEISDTDSDGPENSVKKPKPAKKRKAKRRKY
ncbi:splicing regulator RBM11 isoform X2 [Pseudophryne corroboree]|uniref:splicing regulator RBM11 isoform X2 n=1 Tax=Pseudophryne corroboree TaxID=495146 RepID=UPI003081B6D7